MRRRIYDYDSVLKGLGLPFKVCRIKAIRRLTGMPSAQVFTINSDCSCRGDWAVSEVKHRKNGVALHCPECGYAYILEFIGEE